MQPFFRCLLVEDFITAGEAGSFEVCSTAVDWVYKIIFHTKLSVKISDVS